MSKTYVPLRATVDALDDIDEETVARARAKAERILLRYVSPQVRIAYLEAIERAKAKVRASALREAHRREAEGR